MMYNVDESASGLHTHDVRCAHVEKKEGKMFPEMFVEYWQFFARQPLWVGWHMAMIGRQGVLPGICAARAAQITARLRIPD
jgi:hypothetical protein